jgi:putative transposase
MLYSPKLARHIADAAWASLAHQLAYKQRGPVGSCCSPDRWLPSSKTCSACGEVKERLDLSERTFHSESCGLRIDRDLNAAINLAVWGENHAQTPERQADARNINAPREARSGPRPVAGETSPDEVERPICR